MKKIAIEPDIHTAAPNYKGIVITCSLINSDYDKDTIGEICSGKRN